MNQTASQNPEPSKRDARRTLQKYIVLQIPGAVMVGFLLFGLAYTETISNGMALLLMIGWCAKDAVMYRFVRSAYEPGPPHGTAALVGAKGVVVKDLAPTGTVRISAEHWSARVAEGKPEVKAGAKIRVVAVHGFTVEVIEDTTS